MLFYPKKTQAILQDTLLRNGVTVAQNLGEEEARLSQETALGAQSPGLRAAKSGLQGKHLPCPGHWCSLIVHPCLAMAAKPKAASPTGNSPRIQQKPF